MHSSPLPWSNDKLTSQEPELPETFQVQLEGRWLDADAVPVVLANQLIAQAFQGNVILTFGQATPPALTGTPEDQAAQAQQLEFIPIRALARFSVPPGPLREMADALRTTAAALDAIDAQRGESGSRDDQQDPES